MKGHVNDLTLAGQSRRLVVCVPTRMLGAEARETGVAGGAVADGDGPLRGRSVVA